MNPYTGTNFFTFFTTLIGRLFSFSHPLYPDEIQLLVLVGVSLSCALVGVWLTLRRMAMLANALSHTILLGIAIAFLLWRQFEGLEASFQMPLPYLFGAAILTGVVTTLLTTLLHKQGGVQEEASIGIVFTTLFALGILLINLTARNAHIGIEAVMGNVDALSFDDVKIALPIMGLNILILTLFHKELLLSTFDSSYAKALGYSGHFITYGLMTLISLTIVSAFRSVGVIMVLALLTIPPTIARLITHSLKKMVLLSALVGLLISLFSVALSRHLLTEFGLPLSTGGLLVALLSCAFALTCLYRLTARQKKKRSPHPLKEPH